MKLVYKLIVMAALIGLPLVFVSFQFIQTTDRTLKFKIREFHMNTAGDLADRADSFFRDFEKYCSSFIYNYEETAREVGGFEELLKPMIAQFESVRILTVTHRDGRILLSAPAVEEVSPSALARHVKNIAASTSLEEKRIVRSEAYGDEGTGELFVTLTFPFPDGEHALSAELSLEELQKTISNFRIGRRGFAMLVDEKGRIIAHRNPEKALEKASFPAAARQVPGAGVSVVAEFTGEGGEKMVGAFHPVSGGWSVVVLEPAGDAYYASSRMKNLAAIAILSSALLALVAGVLIIRSILGPMQKLVEGAGEISRGNLAHKVEVDSRDEMGILASAFNRMSSSLSRREEAISSINDTARKISTLLERETLAATALETLVRVTGAETAAMLLNDPGGEEKEITFLRTGNRDTAAVDALPSHVREIIAEAMRDNTPVERAVNSGSGLAAVPVAVENTPVGAVALEGRAGGDSFTPTDVQVTGIIASSVAIALQNITLLEQAIEKTRMEEELKTAELVQKTFFTDKPPDVPGLDLSCFIESAVETGGDYYGFLHEPDRERIAIVIADVTGHGVPAALVTATTSSFILTLEILNASYRDSARDAGRPALFDPLSPEFMLRCLNEIILRTTRGRLVMSVFSSVYYYRERRLVYANAGHNQPIVHREGGTGYLLASGPHVGDAESADFAEHSVVLAPGDTILWYTDGLTECRNENGEAYGDRHLELFLGSLAGSSATEINERIVGELKNFRGDRKPEDDTTFVVGRVLEEPGAAPAPAASIPVADGSGLLPVKSALVAAGDSTFVRQVEWFFRGHGADVIVCGDSRDALAGAAGKNFDFCLLPLGKSEYDADLAGAIASNDTGGGPQVLFSCGGPLEGALPLIHENKLPLRAVRSDSEDAMWLVRVLAQIFYSGRKKSVAETAAHGAGIHRVAVTGSISRMKDAEPLAAFADRLGIRGYDLEVVSFIADELLMNALFHAPVDGGGDRKYASMPRDAHLELGRDEAPALEYGTDGKYLFISVADPFGSLSRDTVAAHLARCGRDSYDPPGGARQGAGLGLAQVLKNADHLLFLSRPGVSLEVCCLIKLKTSVKFAERETASVCFIEVNRA